MGDIVIKLRRICKNRRIYIYGAGIYGRRLYAFLQEHGTGHVETFIVSEAAGEKAVLDRKVITLKAYEDRRISGCESAEADLIIVAVSAKYSSEVIGQLNSRKLHNYLTLTCEEWNVIENEVLFDRVIPQKNIAILAYHRIIDSDYNFWKLNVSPAAFEKHMKYISENYTVLRLEDEWDALTEAGQKYVVITFDDGYVDNYRYALPILEKYHVPATIFVSTDLIDTDKMYWWDELEKMFIFSEYTGEFECNGSRYRIADSADREKACLAIRNDIKNRNPQEQRDTMRALRSALGTERAYTSTLRCVNTQELIEMAASPYITIGGHTKSHLSMGAFHPKELLDLEIRESLKILEEKIGRKVNVFAYPFGGAEDRCDISDGIIAACGIKKSVLIENGNFAAGDVMYNLPRYMVFAGEDMEMKMNKIWGLYG